MSTKFEFVGTIVAGVMLSFAAAAGAQAQTIVNLTNLDPSPATLATTGATDASTNLNLLNTTTALSNGGLFGGAVSTIPAQQATNQLNTLGMTALGGVSPVVLGNQAGVAGGNSVQINEITSAYNATGLNAEGAGSINGSTSATISNTNAAISTGVNQIVGAASGANSPYLGGYGGATGGATVNGGQTGVNTLNGVGAAFADSTSVALSQLPGAPTRTIAGLTTTLSASPVIQGGSVNSSVVNTLLAYTNAGPASVNGASVNSSGAVTSGGGQTAVNTFNTATLVGTNLSVGAQQLADGMSAAQTTTQAVNRALAYSAGNTLANVGGGLSLGVDPSVTNLNQSASAAVNALNLLNGSSTAGTAATTTTLTGLQSVGYNTQVGGTTPTQILTNQASASTAGTGSFLPYGADVTNTGGQISGLAAMTGAGLVNPNNYGVGVNGGYYANGALTNNQANVNDASYYAGYAISGVGNAGLSNVSQAISTTNNTLSAGVSTTTNGVTTPTDLVSLNFGATGFQQRTGTVGVTTNPYGINGANASTNAGTAALSTVSQSFNQASNTLSSTGGLSGTLTQSVDGLNFSASTMGSADGMSGTVTAPNGGPGQVAGIGTGATNSVTGAGALSANNGPYFTVSTGLGVLPPVLNNASANTFFGAASLSGVAQSGTSYTNVATSQGAINTSGAGGTNSGTLTQAIGNISNYGVSGVALNSQVATPMSSGAASVTGATQSLALYSNALSTTSAGTSASGAMTAPALTGSISQQFGMSATAGTANIGTPQNVVGSIAGTSDVQADIADPGNPVFGYIGSNAYSPYGQGTATLANASQSNVTSLNSISSAGASGSNTSPLGVSQQNGTVGTGGASHNIGTSYGTLGAPSNLAVVGATSGAGGNANGSNIGQTASYALNTFSGGSTAGTGVTGNITQTGVGSSSNIGNMAAAFAQTPGTQSSYTSLPTPGVAPAMLASSSSPTGSLGTTGLGVTGVMSGNATMTNVAQGSSQSLNAMSLTGANNGILNQATIGATLQNTSNQVVAQANRGYAVTSGTQVSSNAVNTIAGH